MLLLASSSYWHIVCDKQLHVDPDGSSWVGPMALVWLDDSWVLLLWRSNLLSYEPPL